MCLVPCHEVSNLRPMGFVASSGLEQNTTLIFSLSVSSPLNGRVTICHSHIPRPELQRFVRGKAAWAAPARRTGWGQGEGQAGTGAGRVCARCVRPVLGTVRHLRFGHSGDGIHTGSSVLTARSLLRAGVSC